MSFGVTFCGLDTDQSDEERGDNDDDDDDDDDDDVLGWDKWFLAEKIGVARFVRLV